MCLYLAIVCFFSYLISLFVSLCCHYLAIIWLCSVSGHYLVIKLSSFCHYLVICWFCSLSGLHFVTIFSLFDYYHYFVMVLTLGDSVHYLGIIRSFFVIIQLFALCCHSLIICIMLFFAFLFPYMVIKRLFSFACHYLVIIWLWSFFLPLFIIINSFLHL